MSKLLAFHGNPSIKAQYLDRVRMHCEADQIIQGEYGNWGSPNPKGCAVGCTIHGSNHAAYEEELGIPQILAKLEDRIFEGLPIDEAKEWPSQFLSTINVGSDLSMTWPMFAEWLLMDEQYGVFQYVRKDAAELAIVSVSNLYREWLSTGVKPRFAKWQTSYTAASAAASASAAAAYASADADAAYAAAYAYANAAFTAASASAAYASAYASADADAVAYAAAATYASVAYAYAAYAYAASAAYAYVAPAAAYASARQKFWVAASQKLLQFLSEAK